MATLPNLTRTTFKLNEGQLATREATIEGRRLLLIGTAQRGLTYTPVRIVSINDFTEFFGSAAYGTLGQAVYESLSTRPDRGFDLWAVRVGNGNKASVILEEATSGSGETYASVDSPAITFTAKEAGSLYNQIAIAMGESESSATAPLTIKIWNPATELFSLFTYSANANVTADIHNTAEFVSNVTADPNLSPYLEATLHSRQTDQFEVKVSGLTGYNGVTLGSDGYYQIDLSGLFLNNGFTTTATTLNDDDVMVFGTKLADEGIAANIYNLPITSLSDLKTLDYFGIRGGIEEDVDAAGKFKISLQNIVKLDNDGFPFDVTSIRFAQLNAIIGTSDGTALQTFDVDLFGTLKVGTLVVYATTSNNSKSVLEEGVHYSQVQLDTTLTVSFDQGWTPPENVIITMDFETTALGITHDTLLQTTLDSLSYLHYFVSGKDLYFGSVLPYDITVDYVYDSSVNAVYVNLYDADDGIIKIHENFIVDTECYLQFQWTYLPEMPSLTSAVSLEGGTDGTNMTSTEKYDELDTLMKAIHNFPVDIIVPVRFYVDELETTYSTINGKAGSVPADYFGLLKTHLEDRMDYAGMTIAVMSPALPASTDTATVAAYVNYLTVPDANAVAANQVDIATYLATCSSKHIAITVGAPLITYAGANTYASTYETILGTQLASLPENEVITHDLSNIVGMDMLGLTLTQANTLAGAKFIPLAIWDNAVVPFNGDTFAGAASDYETISTFFIIKGLLDDLENKLRIYYKRLESSSEQEQLMRNDVETVLTYWATSKKLISTSFTFSIYASASEKKRGIRHLKLNVAPAFEQKNIIIDVNLNLGD